MTSATHVDVLTRATENQMNVEGGAAITNSYVQSGYV